MNDKTRELTQGCIVLINMSDVHQINITCKTPCICYCISFSSNLLLFACSDVPNLFSISSHCADVEYFQFLTPAQIVIFINIYNKHEHLTIRHGRGIMEKSLILEIFAYICDIFYNRQEISVTDSRGLTVITGPVNYINANTAGDLSPERLARHVNFSTFRLSRMFKRYTGTTLNEYVTTKRIDKAKPSPKSQVPITTVSREVGFSSYNHFYRAFKNVTGINPVRYKGITEKEK